MHPLWWAKKIDRTFPEGFMRIRDQNPNAAARAFVLRPCHSRKCLGRADGWNNSFVSSPSSSSQQQLWLMQYRSHPSGDFWCWRKLGRFVEKPAPSGLESWVKQAYWFLSLVDAPVVQKFVARGVGIFPYLARVGCVSLPLGVKWILRLRSGSLGRAHMRKPTFGRLIKEKYLIDKLLFFPPPRATNDANFRTKDFAC